MRITTIEFKNNIGRWLVDEGGLILVDADMAGLACKGRRVLNMSELHPRGQVVIELSNGEEWIIYYPIQSLMVQQFSEGKWIRTDEIPAADVPDGLELIAYHVDWIHPDFNLNGTRVGFFQDGEFVSSAWDNNQDDYHADFGTMPSHFVFMPFRPV